MSLIYFIRSPSTSLIKIGTTEDLPRRIASLESAHGHRLELIASCQGGRDLETRLHRYFREWRTFGEWFTENETLTDFALEVARDSSFALRFLTAFETADAARNRALREHLEDFTYELLQRAVALFGGEAVFAGELGVATASVRKRLRRESRDGKTHHAPAKWFVVLAQRPEVGDFLAVSFCLLRNAADHLDALTWNSVKPVRDKLEVKYGLSPGRLARLGEVGAAIRKAALEDDE